jgi:hypothetical protein
MYVIIIGAGIGGLTLDRTRPALWRRAAACSKSGNLTACL